MTGKRYFLLMLQLVWLADAAWAQQRSPFSLQAAVDELHRREAAKFPLNAPPSQQHYLGEQDYWDDDTDFPAYTNNNLRNRHRLNKALAKYLERENYDADNGGLSLSLGPFSGYEFDEEDNNNNLFFNEKKRSTYFRERDNDDDNGSPSVFRERESQISTNPEHAELTEQFLREIEEAQEHEREESYKEALRNLWEKYQQQENEVEGDLFEEKKRMRTPPYYMLMQKKRSYPILPWLPYAAERKKRFPVTKRAAKRSLVQNETPSLGKTEDKVAKELSELFGAPVEEKKKRSVDEQQHNQASTTNTPNIPSTTDMHLELHATKQNNTEHATKELTGNGHADHHHQHKHEHEHEHEHAGQSGSHKHRKHSGDHSHEQNSEETDSEEGDEHDEHDENDEHDEHDDEEDEEDEEDEGEDRKKKRDISMHSAIQYGNKEVPNPSQVSHHEMLKSRRKKSIDWSKYFGLDRKKKSANIVNSKPDLDMKKRSTNEDGANAIDKKNVNLDPNKLDSMDKKLQSIEDFILAETIKYTGAHEGISNPDEIRRVKDHVLSRLATAYSLEKMRLVLEKLRQSVDKENHLLRNIIEPDSQSEESNSLEARKRLSVKKESAQSNDFSHHEKVKDSNSNALQNLESSHNQHNENTEDDDDINKKKKRNSYLRYPEQRNDFSDFEGEPGAGHYEALNDAYLGNKNYIIGSNQCPLIESMAERCRSVDLLSGDINQELLPICGVHQICYLCGFSQGACDYQYLAEADNICGYNTDCHAAARSVLMILRGSPGPQLGPRECVKNPCLQRVMREIGL